MADSNTLPLPLLFPRCSYRFIFQSLTSYMTIVGHSNNLPLAFALITSCAAPDGGELSIEDMRTCSIEQ